MNLKLISDFITGNGGAALNDIAMICHMSKFAKTSLETTQKYNHAESNHDFLIVSNFFGLNEREKSAIMKDGRYCIYAHDYKFVPHMNPCHYEGFKAPEKDLINVDFFNAAKFVVVQSSLQEEIYAKNLPEAKILNISGNFFSDADLDFLLSLKDTPKNGKGAVLKSQYYQKGTGPSIEAAIYRGVEYDLIESIDREEFFKKLSEYEYLFFNPRWPEPLCRVVIEAKCMGVIPFVSNLVGACREPWYNAFSGESLVAFLRKFRDNASEKILNLIRES